MKFPPLRTAAEQVITRPTGRMFVKLLFGEFTPPQCVFRTVKHVLRCPDRQSVQVVLYGFLISTCLATPATWAIYYMVLPDIPAAEVFLSPLLLCRLQADTSLSRMNEAGQ